MAKSLRNNDIFSIYTLLFLKILLVTSLAFSQSSDNWMNVYLNGEKIAYYHETRGETEFRGQQLLRLDSEMVSKLSRFGINFEVHQRSIVYLDKQNKPIYSRYEENMLGSERTVSVYRKDNQMVTETVIGGTTTLSRQEWNPDMQFDASVLETIIQDKLPVGKQYQFSVFSAELGKKFNVSAVVGKTQKIGLGGQWYEATQVKLDYQGSQELSAEYFVMADGTVVKAAVGNYGMVMEKTNEADAKSFGSRVEIADISRVPLNTNINDPTEVTYSRLSVSVTEKTIEEMIPVDARQKWVTPANAASGILVIQSVPEPDKSSLTWPVKLPSKEFSVFTGASPFIESNDLSIISTAKAIVGNEKNAWKAVKLLNQWVYQAVTRKGFDTGFASSKQTLESRKGDCTEHSVLMAALARSLGIPAKVAVGLAAVDDGFYYHMWTEVWVGEWIPLDPTFNETRVNALHLKLAESRTQDDELGDFSLRLLKSLKKIKITLLEYQADGKTITPEVKPSPQTPEIPGLDLGEQLNKELLLP
jgi:transglutaminase-like putative cysteine protease